jgi:hypothetical protein
VRSVLGLPRSALKVSRDAVVGSVAFMDARPYQCRWPLDDAPSATMMVCGAAIAPDPTCPSYCAHHAKLAKSPQQPRITRLYRG